MGVSRRTNTGGVTASTLSRVIREAGFSVAYTLTREGIHVQNFGDCVRVRCDFDTESESVEVAAAVMAALIDLGYTVETMGRLKASLRVTKPGVPEETNESE